MNKYTQYALKELNLIRDGEHKIKTSNVRKVSAKVYRQMKNNTFDEKLTFCEDFLEQRTWELGVIAYDIAFRERKNYTLDTFERFEKWLFKYVKGWGDCDDFCTHAFGALLAQYNELFDKVKLWCKRPEFWVRRAAAVILIYPINKGLNKELKPFEIANDLIDDEHDLVLKGYGWMLKVYSNYAESDVVTYLEENVDYMPRVSFRYAIEKLPLDKKKALMQL